MSNTTCDDAKVIGQLEMDALSLAMKVNVIRSDLKLPQVLEKASINYAVADSADQHGQVKETVTMAQTSSAQIAVAIQDVHQSMVLPEVPLSSTTEILKDISSPLFKVHSPSVKSGEDIPTTQRQNDDGVDIVEVVQVVPISSHRSTEEQQLVTPPLQQSIPELIHYIFQAPEITPLQVPSSPVNLSLHHNRKILSIINFIL